VLAEFRDLHTRNALSADVVSRLCEEIATAVREPGATTSPAYRAAVTLLCEVATLEDETLGQIGQTALFSSLVEALSDSFSEDAANAYDRIFARVIDFCRRHRTGRELDALLRRFAIEGEDDLLRRRARLRERGRFVPAVPLRKAVVLSRVTVGADVAVTSVVLRKLETVFPGAEIVLLAPRQAREVFGADPRIRVADLAYQRQGTLLGRLMAWPVLVAALDRERQGLSDGELVIVDPDSRFTQLGLLPVIEGDVGYCFFESRTWSVPGVDTLGQLTSRWADAIFGGTDQALPLVRLDPGDVGRGERVVAALRAGGASRIAAVNLGVGGNDRKRISEEFERRLVEALLADGHTLVLDKGVGDEVERVDRIVTALRSAGRMVVEVTEPVLATPGAGNLRCDVLTWQGGLGMFGALIGASDVYVGYDSAFQHIAAALEVPVVDIFANAPSPVFVERWTPFSRAPVSVVQAEGAAAGATVDLDRVLGEATAAAGRTP